VHHDPGMHGLHGKNLLPAVDLRVKFCQTNIVNNGCCKANPLGTSGLSSTTNSPELAQGELLGSLNVRCQSTFVR
jgi:hypothetical protein